MWYNKKEIRKVSALKKHSLRYITFGEAIYPEITVAATTVKTLSECDLFCRSIITQNFDNVKSVSLFSGL